MLSYTIPPHCASISIQYNPTEYRDPVTSRLGKVDPHLVEGIQKLQEVCLVHFGRSVVGVARLLQHGVDFLLDNFRHVRLGIDVHGVVVLRGQKRLVVLLQNLKHVVGLEAGSNGFVFPHKADAEQAVPLVEVDVGSGLFHLDSHHRRLHLWWRTEVVLAHLHDVRDVGPHLHVGRQPTVQAVARAGQKPQCKFSLEHENGHTGRFGLVQKLEHQRRRDLVRRVGDAHVEVRQVRLHEVAQEDFQLLLLRSSMDSFGQLRRHSRVHLHCHHFAGLLQDANGQVSCSGTNLQHNVAGFDLRLVHNALCDKRVFKNVLAEVGVELEHRVHVFVGSHSWACRAGGEFFFRCLGHGKGGEKMR